MCWSPTNARLASGHSLSCRHAILTRNAVCRLCIRQVARFARVRLSESCTRFMITHVPIRYKWMYEPFRLHTANTRRASPRILLLRSEFSLYVWSVCSNNRWQCKVDLSWTHRTPQRTLYVIWSHIRKLNVHMYRYWWHDDDDDAMHDVLTTVAWRSDWIFRLATVMMMKWRRCSTSDRPMMMMRNTRSFARVNRKRRIGCCVCCGWLWLSASHNYSICFYACLCYKCKMNSQTSIIEQKYYTNIERQFGVPNQMTLAQTTSQRNYMFIRISLRTMQSNFENTKCYWLHVGLTLNFG